MPNLAPIALFAYNRPDHLQVTLTALANNSMAKASELFIFCDGSKVAADAGVDAVRKLAKSAKGFKNIQVIERSDNWGLAKSIISGVTQIVNQFGKVIVLEDDIVTSPEFLNYMNSALDKYEHDSRVASIHSWVHPVNADLPETFFLRGADCWGWATWKRGWENFAADGQKLLDGLKAKNLTAEFDLDGSYAYTRMLQDQIAGKNNSWAIRWHASAFLKNMLTLYPGKTLTKNIGLDGSGTHCDINAHYSSGEIALQAPKLNIDSATEDRQARETIIRYLKSSRNSGRGRRLLSKVKTFAKVILPQPMIRTLQKIRATQGLEFEGPFANWAQASTKAEGYGSADILQKVKTSTMQVVLGNAAYERDSVTFKDPSPNVRLVSLISELSKNLGRAIHILDFGGSLGSSYWQNRHHFTAGTVATWSVVEQPTYVATGRASFQNDQLKFYLTAGEIPSAQAADLVIFSAVLHYLESPYKILEQLASSKPQAIFIDRTPLTDASDSLWIQKVPPSIYQGSYPCWVLNKKIMTEQLAGDYSNVAEWDSLDGRHTFGKTIVPFKGLLFARKNLESQL